MIGVSIETISTIQMIMSFREFVPEDFMLEKIEDVLRGRDGKV